MAIVKKDLSALIVNIAESGAAAQKKLGSSDNPMTIKEFKVHLELNTIVHLNGDSKTGAGNIALSIFDQTVNTKANVNELKQTENFTIELTLVASSTLNSNL